MDEICVKFDDLTLGYAGRPAVHAGKGSISRGALMAVVGANGSGKSTFLKGIAGIVRPMSGMLLARCNRLAYLPQQSEIDRSFPARVIDLVSLGFWQSRGLLGRIRDPDRLRLTGCLESVGLKGLENRPLDSLSGGQLQRALFARTMLQDADLILLDEPFNAVDSRTIDDLLTLMKHWVGERRTVICVLHDLGLVRRHFPEAMLLAGELVASGPTANVLAQDTLERARDVQARWQARWDEQAAELADGQTVIHPDNTADAASVKRAGLKVSADG